MKKTSAIRLILGGMCLVVVSSSCHKSTNTVSSGKSKSSIQMVKKGEIRDTLVTPFEVKPEEIYDIVPVPASKH